MADDLELPPTRARELVAELQFAQLRVRLGLAKDLPPIALDPDHRFEILEILGVGGMGVVFLGHDTKLNRRVALKVLRRRMLALEQLEDRLMREAQILASLQDRNILVVYDIGRARSGELFLATQYIAGQTLREWQAGRSYTEILNTYIEAGRGLAAAHERDIVHRDFKPENVLLEPGAPPKVYVGDFGLADGPTHDALAQRSTQARLGTPAYMAPEQLRQEPASPQSDQYSFCVALWEACSGARPPSTDPPERAPNMPRWLYRLLVVGLSPRPQDRHSNLALLLTRIEAARRGRRRMHVTFLALGLLGLSLGLGYAMGKRPPSCSDLVAVDEPWSVLRAVTLQGQLTAMPFEYAPRTAATIITALHTNVEARHELALTTCEARARDPDDEHLDAQAQCIERWRARTNEQIDALAQIDAEHFVDAFELLVPLDELAELCRRGGGLAPLDPEVRDALANAENASLLLEHERGLGLAEAAVALAEGRGQPCAGLGSASRELGHAHHRLGRALLLAGRAELARDEFLVAIEHARRCEDDELQIVTHIHLAQLYALQLGRVDTAQFVIDAARDKLDTLGEPSISLRRAWVLETEGFIALAENRPREAIPPYRRALDALGGTERHPVQAARMYANIGAAQQEAGAYDDARKSNELARNIVAEQLGMQHPKVQTHLRWVRLNDSLLARDNGNSELAKITLAALMDAPEPAIRIRATSAWLEIVFDGTTTPEQLDRAHELIADLRAEPRLAPHVRAEGLTLAGHLLAGADDEAGFELLREALVLWLAHFPNDPHTATTAVGLAQALHYAERDDEAREACRAVHRLTVPLPDDVAAALVTLEQELGM